MLLHKSKVILLFIFYIKPIQFNSFYYLFVENSTVYNKERFVMRFLNICILTLVIITVVAELGTAQFIDRNLDEFQGNQDAFYGNQDAYYGNQDENHGNQNEITENPSKTSEWKEWILKAIVSFSIFNKYYKKKFIIFLLIEKRCETDFKRYCKQNCAKLLMQDLWSDS